MLFKATTDIQKILPFTENFEFDAIKPYIQNAEIDFIIPAIGQSQYDDLNDAYTAATSESDLSSENQRLLQYIRRPLANYAFLLYIPFGNVNIGKSGFSVTENDTTKIASQWRIEDLKSACMRDSFMGMERLLLMMETYKSDYSLWTASTSYSVYKEGFINNATDFQLYVDIKESRMLFTKLRPMMMRVEPECILPITGQALYDEIKSQVVSGSITTANKKALALIKSAVANITISESLRMQTVSWTDNGLQLISTSSSLTQVNESPVDEQKIDLIKNEFRALGMRDLDKLKKFLYDNHADYPLYEADDTVYVAPSSLEVENDKTRSTYFL